MLELREITKAYRTANLVQVALDRVSVAFRDNEFVAVLGQSGSGKTTMLNVIGGLDRFQRGDLVIDGVSTKAYRARDWDAYRNNRIGFVFQSYNLIPHQSVLANVELALTLSGVSRGERRKRALDALDRVGLSEHVRKLPSQMSGGQMQRVAIARALINDPEILLADEPTGALDSKTSVQVMDLLREVAKDRLVIMVTHNPELAHQYATRIVELADGRIVADSEPFTPGTEEVREAKPARRTSMGFLTALALSFNNLMTKKGRTLMTSFAGSIGIIGIAAILALANGANAYIQRTEEDALSSYPLTIQKQGFSMESMMSSAVLGGSSTEGDPGGVRVSSRQSLTGMIQNAKTNDLKSLKVYLDNNGGGIRSHASSVEYGYGTTPLIFQQDTSKGLNQVSPEPAFSPIASARGGSANPMSSTSLSTDAFYQMPTDRSLYADAYDVLAGTWPTGADDLVLVLDAEGQISDVFEYTLGLKDHKDLQSLMCSYYSGQMGRGAGSPQSGGQSGAQSGAGGASPTVYDYSQILGTAFSRVNAPDQYTYDSTYRVWTDHSADTDYMKDLVSKGQRLTITGIVKPKSSSRTPLRQGIGYTADLTYRVIDEAGASQIVKDQIASPTIDVFTGKTFKELADGQKNKASGFDMSSLFSVDEGKLGAAFQIDPSKLQMDMSALDFSGLDLSGFDFSQLDMSGMDLSGLDPSALVPSGAQSGLLPGMDLGELTKQFPQLADIDFAGIVSAALKDGAVKEGAGEYLASRASQIAQDFIAYVREQAAKAPDLDGDGIPDIDLVELVSDYMKSADVARQLTDAVTSDQVIDSGKLIANLTKALGDDPAIAQIAQAVSQQIADAISTQIAGQLSGLLGQGMGAVLSQMMSDTMGQAMGQMMEGFAEQIRARISSAMDGFAEAMSSAVSIDPGAFADAFSMNFDEKSLAALMATMMSTNVPDYDTNLRGLGWAAIDSPTTISIYPKSFADKDEVKKILDAYSADQVSAGAPDKAITYTDLMGTLMSSVTSIIDVISWLLIAFVSISLVVSSIMIAIITYISVLERRKEIGILRSIGASKGDVSRVFNAETVIEGFLAGVMGVGITYGLCSLVNAVVSSVFDVHGIAQLSPVAALALIAVSVGLTVFAGLIPASRAARQDPVEALRSE
ncbi:efflux ABC transporter, permease protein [Schaalia georgiae F0490]|uniref:Efflux ABC transporter, permease protein n=1 Tax=Schaalia georgiae F0490 TaxID=1125717 RepID=J0NEJ9_9ACTO|nr:ABC transporter ATP-binding protein/permease [Schaalia georgiae]EJF45459.1 efflux ABC transporter, permease protein [Schaalia georgiae F0490]